MVVRHLSYDGCMIFGDRQRNILAKRQGVNRLLEPNIDEDPLGICVLVKGRETQRETGIVDLIAVVKE